MLRKQLSIISNNFDDSMILYRNQNNYDLANVSGYIEKNTNPYETSSTPFLTGI